MAGGSFHLEDTVNSQQVWAETLTGGDYPLTNSKSSHTYSEISQPEWSEAPFHKEDLGDCIVKSSDAVHFMASKTILHNAAPVIRRLFERTDLDTIEGKPVVSLPQNARILRNLLLPIYHIHTLDLKTVEDILDVINVSEEYAAIPVAFIPPIRSTIRSPSFMEGNTMEALSIAWRLRLHDEIVLISRYTHKIADISSPALIGMVSKIAGSAQPLFALYKMRLLRERALLDIVRHFCRPEGLRQGCKRHNKSKGDPKRPLDDRDVARYRSYVATLMAEPFPNSTEISISHGLGCEDCREATAKVVRRAWEGAKAAIQSFPQELAPEMIEYS